MTQEESVPIGELQALVEEWREQGYECRTNPNGSMGRVGEGEAKEACADSLQAVIEDYE